MRDVIRLLIVEDNADLSANLAEFFESDEYVLDFAQDALGDPLIKTLHGRGYRLQVSQE